MKLITRTVEQHEYIFGRYDLETGEVKDVQKLESATALSQKKLNAFAKESGGLVCLKHNTVEAKYALPLDDFIRLAKEYAAEPHEDVQDQAEDGEPDSTEDNEPDSYMSVE